MSLYVGNGPLTKTPTTPAQIKSAFLDLFRCTTCDGDGKELDEVSATALARAVGFSGPEELDNGPCPDCVDGWKLDDELGDTFIDWRTMSPRDQWQRILDMLEALEAE